MPTLSFDKNEHKYKLDGVWVPSVTQILQDCKIIDFTGVRPDVLQQAAIFGTTIHTACEFDDLGQLDEGSISEEVLGYVQSWRKFISEHEIQFLEIELRVHSEKYRFAGTLDRIAVIDGELAIIDIKTGQKQPAYALQTAAYALCYKELTGKKIKKRFAVYLSEDGYKLQEYKDRLDEQMFLTALTLFNWKRR